MSDPTATAPPLPPPYVPTGAQGGPAPTEPRPPLRRSRSDRVLGGVAGGLAHTFGVDPVIFRVVFAVLTLIGGSGLVLYLLLWLLLPEEGSDSSSTFDRWVRERRWSTTTVLGLAVVVAVALSILLGLDPGALVLLSVLAAVAIIVLSRNRPSAGHDPAQAYAPAPATPPGTPPPATPPPPAPPRQRSMLGLITLGAATAVAGALLAWRIAGGGDEPTATTILAATTAVLGVGLLVGTFVGRARWLVVPGVVLLMSTAAASSVESYAGPTGQETIRPTTLAQVDSPYAWRAGDLVLDLTELEGSPDLDVAFRLGAGSLRVIVPSDAVVVGTAEARAGSVRAFGRESDGFGVDVDLAAAGAPPLGLVPPVDDPDRQTIVLTLEVGLGEVVIRRG